MKAKVKYTVIPDLPPNIAVLKELAYNFLFSWKGEIQELFQRMDPGLWQECDNNPVLMLGRIGQERLEALSKDQGFVAQLERVHQEFDRYMAHPHVCAEDYCPGEPFSVAYFSAEFGLSSCMPIYSGGLGILAGDHVKSASDLNVPLVGVGLLYQEGYFSQYLSADGWQMERYPINDFENLPLSLCKTQSGDPVRVSVDFKGKPVKIQVWRADVGRVPLYLLDTNIEENPPEYKGTTAQLYGGDRDMRIRQEIVLGIGGVRALKALGIEPTVVHMNEGHSAFSALERINILKNEKGLSFDAAMEHVLATTVFTTHTPVPAGNDIFDPELFRAYFERYAQGLGLYFKVLLGMGRINPVNDSEPFGMTTLALRLSAHTNGVSRLHGSISRAMWNGVWPDNPEEDVPIDYITNGVHVPTWISSDLASLFDRYLGPDWAEEPDNEKLWTQVEQIPATELWRTHERCRERLVGFTRLRLSGQLRSRGASESEIQAALEVLSPETLTIGMARRFATYKRATLLFRDPDRLDRIINNPDRPVQIIIAGKAHPQDNEGKEFIKQIIHLARQERFRRKIVFLEDYNIKVAHYMVSGCDIWLNTPRRPLEACGTSGMKAMANGCLNLSTLDGWWDEGYHPDLGWTIGHGELYRDLAVQDDIESMDLYNTLEKEIAPLFYSGGSDRIPRGWVQKMRSSLRYLAPVYNSHRMMQEYVDYYYLPCSKRFNAQSVGEYQGAKDLAQWRQHLMTNWHLVAVEPFPEEKTQEFRAGQSIPVAAKVSLGGLTPDDVSVEIYYGRLGHNGDFVDRETAPMEMIRQADGHYIFEGEIPCRKTGRFGYTVRILPSQERLENRFLMGLITWA